MEGGKKYRSENDGVEFGVGELQVVGLPIGTVVRCEGRE